LTCLWNLYHSFLLWNPPHAPHTTNDNSDSSVTGRWIRKSNQTKYKRLNITWRFGSSIDRRPVAVDVCSQFPCMMYLWDWLHNWAREQMDPNVPFNSLANVLCSLITETIGCRSLKKNVTYY
jgi:hypothetical protein